MKKTFVQIVLLCFLTVLNSGCTTDTTTTVSIINSSSQDLNIKFIAVENPMNGDTRNQYKDIDLIKGASFTFFLTRSGPSSYRRPNDEVKMIYFSDLNTGVIIKELDNAKEKVFVLTNSKSDWMGELEAEYLLEITDNLLR